MGDNVRLHLFEGGADPQRLAELTGFLRDDLLRLDVAGVAPLPVGEPPAGSKAFDVFAVGGLVVSLGRSVFGLRDVVSAVRNWLTRGQDVTRTVRIEIGGDVLDLTSATAAEQERLIDMFVDRHTGAGPG